MELAETQPDGELYVKAEKRHEKSVNLWKLQPLILRCVRRDRHQPVQLAEHLGPSRGTRAFLDNTLWEHLV
jgi:hypothetical protein